MQTTSATWDALLADDDSVLETKAIINGAEYTQISAPVIMRALVQDSLSIGNAVSANLQLSVMTDDVIPRSAKVVIKHRLVGPDGITVSEWIDAGTFYISHRQKDAVSGLLTFDCYDALLRANAEYQELNARWVNESGAVIVTEHGNQIVFGHGSSSMKNTVNAIAQYMGVEVDPRTELQDGEGYVIEPSGSTLTMRDVLCGIAAVHGGNWIITPENKLRLVTIFNDISDTDPEDIPSTRAVLGSLTLDSVQTITGMRVMGDDEQMYGTYEGAVIDVNSPYVTNVVINELLEKLVGQTYQPYTMVQGIFNPALELGDYIKIYNDVTSVIYSQTVKLSPMYTGDMSAPPAMELSDEYPYITTGVRVLNEAKNYTDELDNSLDQQSVFDRLTNGGADQGVYLYQKKVYINGEYIKANSIAAGSIDATNLHVSAANVDGTLIAGQIAAGAITLAKLDSDAKDALANDEQIIYKSQASSTAAPAANTTWVTDATGAQNTWTTVRPEYSTSYPKLYTAKQKKTAAQASGTTCSCTTPTLDKTTTIIDGGNIITGTVSADAISATSGTFNSANIPNLSAGKITSGTMSANRISGGSIDATNVTITNLNADNITSGTLSANFIEGGILKSTITVPNEPGLPLFLLNLASAVMDFYSADGTRHITIDPGTLGTSLGEITFYQLSSSAYTKRMRIGLSTIGSSLPIAEISAATVVDCIRLGVDGSTFRGISVPGSTGHTTITGGLDVDGRDMIDMTNCKTYSVRGADIVKSASYGTTGGGTTCGAGHAKVVVLGKTVMVNFAVKITTAGTENDVYDVGISVARLRDLNSNIPAFTVANGGQITYYNASGQYAAINGYGGEASPTTVSNRWNFGRTYYVSKTNEYLYGSWSDSHFPVDTTITGVLYGSLD